MAAAACALEKRVADQLEIFGQAELTSSKDRVITSVFHVIVGYIDYNEYSHIRSGRSLIAIRMNVLGSPIVKEREIQREGETGLHVTEETYCTMFALFRASNLISAIHKQNAIQQLSEPFMPNLLVDAIKKKKEDVVLLLIGWGASITKNVVLEAVAAEVSMGLLEALLKKAQIVIGDEIAEYAAVHGNFHVVNSYYSHDKKPPLALFNRVHNRAIRQLFVNWLGLPQDAIEIGHPPAALETAEGQVEGAGQGETEGATSS